MSWKVRHEGSPRFVEGLTPPQVVQGLLDGHWEPTDEVMGPEDQRWQAIESHPQFAEVAADLEPPTPKSHDDETHLDMTPLIDVCLVLLVFFILTTTYAVLERLIDMPSAKSDKPSGVPKRTQEQVKELMVKVEARMTRQVVKGKEKDVPVIRVEGETVEADPNTGLPDGDRLRALLGKFANGAHKTELLIDYDQRVPYGTIIEIQDAAAGVRDPATGAPRITQVHIYVPAGEGG
jgi:biopolymer transport protein ExbD